MAFKDLREFIEVLHARGDIRTISGANPELEIGGVSQIAADSPQSPALLFDSITGFAAGARVLTNALAGRARERLVFGMSEELSDKDALRSLKDKLKACRRMAPVKARQAPIRQNSFVSTQIDLAQLPWLRWHEGDCELRHHDAVMIMRDPGSHHIEIALADLVFNDRTSVKVFFRPARSSAPWQKYWADGKSCPIAVLLGHEPALLAAALIGSPNGNLDYGFVGWLRGAPVEIIDDELTGLPIPATAELALAGDLTPPTRGSEPTVKIQRIDMRDDPILLGSAPFFGATHGVLASRAASLWNELARLGSAEIVAVNQRPWGVTILAIKQGSEGDVGRTARALMESFAARDLGYAVIVDEDIDPYNLEKVFWAIATRYEAQQSVQIMRRLPAAADAKKKAKIDAGSSADTGSAAIIDACRPFRWIDKFPRTTDISEELMRKTIEKWGKLLERRS